MKYLVYQYKASFSQYFRRRLLPFLKASIELFAACPHFIRSFISYIDSMICPLLRGLGFPLFRPFGRLFVLTGYFKESIRKYKRKYKSKAEEKFFGSEFCKNIC